MLEMLAKEKFIEILGRLWYNGFSDCDNLKTIRMKCHPRSCNSNTENSEQIQRNTRTKSQHLPQSKSKKFWIEAQQNHGPTN